MPLASTKRWQLHHRGPDGGGKDLLKGSGAFRGKRGGRQGGNHLGIVDLEIKYIIKNNIHFYSFIFFRFQKELAQKCAGSFL